MPMGLEQIRIVLVEPLYSGNVGAVCRAMANMGIGQLAVVNPAHWDETEARRMACHAAPVLEARRRHATLAEAVADCALTVGTTGREGLYRRHARSPRDWAPAILDAAASGPVALIFGREDNGLSNEELALCQHLIRIPTADACPSLNLAQAVLLCCYEVFLLGGAYTPLEEKAPPATNALRERMLSLWRELLLEVGFMQEAKADHMMLGVRRVFGRGVRTEDDARIIMGIARQVQWAIGNRKAPDRDPEPDRAGEDAVT